MIVEAIITAVGGYLLHKFRRITERMDNGWQQLTSYAIGVMGVLPFFLLFTKRTGKKNRCFIAYIFAFLFAGVGVAVGWLVDSIGDYDG